MEEFLHELMTLETGEIDLSFDDSTFIVTTDTAELRFISYRENPEAIRTERGFSITASEVELHKADGEIIRPEIDDVIDVNIAL